MYYRRRRGVVDLCIKEKKPQEELGRLGEILIGKIGCQTVYFSYDAYDSQKDLMAGGKTIQVKTMELFHTQQALSIKPNQLHKCRTVDRLFMIALNIRCSKESGKCYEIDQNSSSQNHITPRMEGKCF